MVTSVMLNFGSSVIVAVTKASTITCSRADVGRKVVASFATSPMRIEIVAWSAFGMVIVPESPPRSLPAAMSLCIDGGIRDDEIVIERLGQRRVEYGHRRPESPSMTGVLTTVSRGKSSSMIVPVPRACSMLFGSPRAGTASRWLPY